MIYSDSKGVKWFLHTRDVILPRNKVKAVAYYFSKEKKENYFSQDLPIKYKVIETHSGLPMVKKV